MTGESWCYRSKMAQRIRNLGWLLASTLIVAPATAQDKAANSICWANVVYRGLFLLQGVKSALRSKIALQRDQGGCPETPAEPNVCYHALTACRSTRSAIAAIESSSVKSKLISEKLIP